MARQTTDTMAWLRSSPAPEELVEAYPDEWLQVQRDFHEIIERDDADEIKSYMARVSRPQDRLPGRTRPLRERLIAEVRRQMAVHLLKQAILSASTGVTEGRV